MEINIKNLNFSYENKEVLKDINLNFKKGKIYTILGPNGTGKSTLLKIINRWLKVPKGKVFYDDMDINLLKTKDIARKVGVIPQENNWQFDFMVKEIVLMGRYIHLGRFENEKDKDIKIADEAMRNTNTYALKNRNINKISGGEKQRVIVARALAQETPVILLDEPVSQLDLYHQLEIINIIQSLVIKEKKTAICVLHDINLAIEFSDELIFMKEGRILNKGTPDRILNKDLIKETYGVDTLVIRNKLTNKPHVIYGNIKEENDV